MLYKRFLGLLLVLLVLALPVLAIGEEDEDIPQADIVNDEGGPVAINGEVTYTNAFFTLGVSEPLIILEDQTGFVNRDRDYVFPVESQQLGQITSDFFTSPFSYSMALPTVPQAPLNDVDNDGEDDPGVMIFQIAYWTNTFGDAFLEERDLYGGGWSSAYASAEVSSRVETRGEYTGGSVLIYAPEEGQAFPSGFGEDEMLFTADDPLVIVPQGYTLVNMDTDPFTFDRSREPVVDLIEGEGAEADNFSSMSYTEAFDAMVDKFRREYAFTEFKNLDWDALALEYRPLIEEAEANNDGEAFAFALQEFLWQIPDGHVAMSFVDPLVNQFFLETDGGLGIAIREVDDGSVIVNFVLEGSPADEAGLELGAEIIAIDGTPILDVVDEAQAWSAPFSTEHVRRLQQLRYAVRFPLDTEVEVTFRNPGGEEQTVTMTTVAERESFSFSSFNVSRTGYELPVEYEPLGDYIYVSINSFSDDSRLTVQLWERMLQQAISNQVPALIIDMRNNGGGSGFLADQMAAYFFQEELVLGNTGFYDEDLDEFYFDEDSIDEFFLPPEELRYTGEVTVLVGPNCASACEFFSYDMTLNDRATIIGQYPTAGLGGSVQQFFMPDGLTVQFTIGRAVDADGDIHIEGQGVVPDVRVPVTEETLFAEGDVILDFAVNYLDEQLAEAQAEATLDGGEIGYDEDAEGSLEVGQRARYSLTLREGEEVGVYIVSEALDTYLRIYDESGETLLAENDDYAGSINSGIEIPALDQDLPVIVEVGTFNDEGAGDYTLVVTTGEAPIEANLNIEDGGSIAVDDEVTGEIANGQRIQYTLELTAGENINVYMTGDLDTYLRIYDAAGEALLAENDDFDGLTSGIEGFSLPEGGTVIVEAATFADSDAGTYTLTVESASDSAAR